MCSAEDRDEYLSLYQFGRILREMQRLWFSFLTVLIREHGDVVLLVAEQDLSCSAIRWFNFSKYSFSVFLFTFLNYGFSCIDIK